MISGEELDKLMKDFIEFLKTKEGRNFVKERKEKLKFTKKLLSKNRLLSMTEEEFVKFVKNWLWAANMWSNKEYLAKEKLLSANGGIDKVRRELYNLLYGSGSVDLRFDNFVKKMKNFGPAIVTEIMAFSNPNKYSLWNKTQRISLSFIFGNELRKYSLNGNGYIKEIELQSKLKQKLSKYIKNPDFIDVDLFLFYVRTHVVKKESKKERKVKTVTNEEFPMELLDKVSQIKFEPHKTIGNSNRLTVRELYNKVREGSWVIPDFQRRFKWKHTDIAKLLESIIRGYYIGSLLLWEKSSNNIGFSPIEGLSVENAQSNYFVLDGQQRITSIFYALAAPKLKLWSEDAFCRFFLNIRGLFDDSEQLIITVCNGKSYDDITCFRKALVPFYRFLDYTDWLQKFRKYLFSKCTDDSCKNKVYDFTTYLGTIIDSFLDKFEVPYVVLSKHINIAEVVEIFERINTLGLKLDIFDLLTAKFLIRGIHLRDLLKEAEENNEIKELKRLEINVGVVLVQIIALVNGKSIHRSDLLKLDQNYDNPSEFTEDWNNATKYLIKAYKSLVDPRTFGVIGKKYLPTKSIVPVIAALYWYLEKNSLDIAQNYDKIKRFYWAISLTNRYSGSSDTKMMQDTKEMKRWFDNDKALPEAIRDFEIDFNKKPLSEVREKGSSRYRAIVCLINVNGAKDFVKGEFIEYQNNDLHHIFPESKELVIGVPKKMLDSILNKTLLSQETNRFLIKDKLPSKYIREILEKYYNNDEDKFIEILKSHFINKAAYEALLNNDFNSFIRERENEIKKFIYKLVLGKEAPENLNIIPVDPFGNELKIKQTISKLNDAIYWVDKYFSKKGLVYLYDAINPSVKKIRILMAPEKATEDFRNEFKKFRDSMRHRGIDVELHVMNNKIKRQIHDRWVFDSNVMYNIPSPDVIARGQYSVIKEVKTVPFDFEELWKNSFDIIGDWNKIKEMTKQKLNSCHYDLNWYKSHFNAHSAEEFWNLANKLEDYIRNKGWHLIRTNNSHYISFKDGARVVFAIQFVGSKSFCLVFKLPKDIINNIKINGVDLCRYEDRWKQALYKINGKVDLLKFDILFRKAYEYITSRRNNQ